MNLKNKMIDMNKYLTPSLFYYHASGTRRMNFFKYTAILTIQSGRISSC